MKLNIGCGNHYADGWVNVDIDQTDEVCPDVQADLVAGLPFPDGVAKRIYLGHVLEHLDPTALPAALAECARLLAPGGALMIVGPDCDRADELLASGAIDEVEHGLVVHGAGRWAHDVHLWRSTPAATGAALTAAWFEWRPVPIWRVPVEWPVVSRIDWQFAIAATHPLEVT